MPADLLLSPVGLGVFGLVIGSFLNVVIHRLPLILERQWWRDVAHQIVDADSWTRVFRAPEGSLVLAVSGSTEQVT